MNEREVKEGLTYIRCTCHLSFTAIPDTAILSGGDDVQIYVCPRCMTKYLAVKLDSHEMPQLAKLTNTKAVMLRKEK